MGWGSDEHHTSGQEEASGEVWTEAWQKHRALRVVCSGSWRGRTGKRQ